MESLWSEIESYLKFWTEESERRPHITFAYPFSMEMPKEQQIQEMRVTLQPVKEAFDSSLQTSTTVSSASANTVEKTQEEKFSLPASMPKTTFLPSEVVEQHENLKMRYIVGKKAGSDLFTRFGKRIIARGETITKEIVEEADREGKLVELILNMVIDELDKT
ncbi:hypothetical protein [Alicyclobacillus tolerans]|uniref:Uncharacterized protein n=2 Tax=Alicyclobacillus tolerans TaxID=90970 RepID=A0A1M6VSV5_9BACL|nr:hypothetical protein [Alicyclobacillus montanus]SHK84481.1 hypothetical protein SAMN05443507_12424 [Alicyclobacillus montanus]